MGSETLRSFHVLSHLIFNQLCDLERLFLFHFLHEKLGDLGKLSHLAMVTCLTRELQEETPQSLCVRDH